MQRILKTPGYLLLTWNVRNNERSDFMLAYETFLLNYSSDYEQVREVNHNTAEFDTFFGSRGWSSAIFENSQSFDFEGLLGRYLSASYAFPENHPCFADAETALRVIFDADQQEEKVTLWYDTVLYYGRMLSIGLRWLQRGNLQTALSFKQPAQCQNKNKRVI